MRKSCGRQRQQTVAGAAGAVAGAGGAAVAVVALIAELRLRRTGGGGVVASVDGANNNRPVTNGYLLDGEWQCYINHLWVKDTASCDY